MKNSEIKKIENNINSKSFKVNINGGNYFIKLYANKENFTKDFLIYQLLKRHNLNVPNLIDYNPNKKPAPPAFNKNINDNILSEAKKLVSEANPDQPDIANKLFNDIGSELMFEQSLRPFTSNPSTTIPNDQAGFAEFCYGSMVSCKEGNQFACARNLVRHTN